MNARAGAGAEKVGERRVDPASGGDTDVPVTGRQPAERSRRPHLGNKSRPLPASGKKVEASGRPEARFRISECGGVYERGARSSRM